MRIGMGFSAWVLAGVMTAGLLAVPDTIVGQTTSRAPMRGRYYTPYMQAYQAQYGNQWRGRSPVATPRPTMPPVTGTVERYSPLEYGQIVLMAVEAARENTPAPNTRGTSVRLADLATTTTPSGVTGYIPISMNVSQVIDRGILLLPTGEELRLRGVVLPSNTDTNAVRRLYAKEAIQALTQATQAGAVTILLDDPLRDPSGRLLGTVILPDGTELNRRMLELGYGSVNGQDFGTGVSFSDLQEAEAAAKEKRLGIWSR